MRIYATARADSASNAVGQVELECTLAGLVVGLFGLGSYSEGYVPGLPVRGTRLVVPWSDVKTARAFDDELYVEFSHPALPHDRLTLTRFVHGPGVPAAELRRRRLLLHLGALGVAFAAALCTAFLSPPIDGQSAAWGALGYGVVAAAVVLAFGYAFDQRLFLRPPGEEETRARFLAELERFFPGFVRGDAPPRPTRPFEWPNLAGFVPRTTALVGITLAAAILTALASGRRLLGTTPSLAQRAGAGEPVSAMAEEPASAQNVSNAAPAPAPSPAPVEPTEEAEAEAPKSADAVSIERRCACDRADSLLWPQALPRLTTLLLERRAIRLRSYTRTEVEVAVVNNGDAPLSEITLLVQFSEEQGGKPVPTKDRPLYFEGPLLPGQAIKWSTEARGTDFTIASPDVGALGPNGEGAAPADAFFTLSSSANHRPVRLHAARMLGYLGDPRARDAALGLKDALRSQEAPYLRRVLAALGDTRTCDVELARDSVGACVFNAGSEAHSGLGLQLQVLDGSLNVDQPLADPPERLRERKWQVPGELGAQAGVYVRVPLSGEFVGVQRPSLEVLADRYDLLE
jgi:hypothetical protein